VCGLAALNKSQKNFEQTIDEKQTLAISGESHLKSTVLALLLLGILTVASWRVDMAKAKAGPHPPGRLPSGSLPRARTLCKSLFSTDLRQRHNEPAVWILAHRGLSSPGNFVIESRISIWRMERYVHIGWNTAKNTQITVLALAAIGAWRL
jgi:hypothetical protein